MDQEDQARLDDWQIWRGVGGIWYARRPRSSPPWVIRDATRDHLEQRIIEGEAPPWRHELDALRHGPRSPLTGHSNS
jgi:hypothetical protein